MANGEPSPTPPIEIGPDRYRAVLTRLTGSSAPTDDELAGDGVLMNILEAICDRFDRLDGIAAQLTESEGA